MTPTTDEDIAFLDDWLMSNESPENCMMISDLDGFLAAIAIGPELIPPSEWLPRIWNGGSPKFKSKKKAERVLGIIMARYNEIIHDVMHSPEDYQPLFWEHPEIGMITGDWGEGFLDGIVMRRAAWEPLLTSAKGAKLMAPIYAGIHPDAIKEILGLEVKSAPGLMDKCPDLIPGAIVEIRKLACGGFLDHS